MLLRVRFFQTLRTGNTSASSPTVDTLLLKRKRRTLSQTAVITAATNVIPRRVSREAQSSNTTHLMVEPEESAH